MSASPGWGVPIPAPKMVWRLIGAKNMAVPAVFTKSDVPGAPILSGRYPAPPVEVVVPPPMSGMGLALLIVDPRMVRNACLESSSRGVARRNNRNRFSPVNVPTSGDMA